MKINNLEKFYPEGMNEENYRNAKKRSTVVTRGDFIKLYAETNSDNPYDWHVEATSNDRWWKMSFDRGFTFPIIMKFDGNSFSTSFTEDSAWEPDSLSSFVIAENFEELKEGNVRLFEVDENSFKKENKEFKYKFGQISDSTSGIIVRFPSTVSDDIQSYEITIKTGIDAQAYGVEKAVATTLVSAIPSVYDQTYGTCNYLDSEISSIECISRLSDVNKMKLRLVSADPLYGGNIVLRFTCGHITFNQTVAVTTSEEYVEIILPATLSGTLTIERLYTDANDTLADDNIVISAILTGIKLETV